MKQQSNKIWLHWYRWYSKWMGFAEYSQNMISKGIQQRIRILFWFKKEHFNATSHQHQIKRTNKRIVTDHMKVKFISSGCCSLWSCCFWTSLCQCNLSCVMLFSPRITRRWILSISFSHMTWIIFREECTWGENRGSLKNQMAVPLKTFLFFTVFYSSLQSSQEQTRD